MLEGHGCEYVAKEGRSCIKAARANKKECSDSAAQEIADACDEVYECDESMMGLELDGAPAPTFAIEDASESIDPMSDAAFGHQL